MDDHGELTPYSSIRRMRELPTMTMNALLREGIHTVQDLKECPLEDLRRVPVIGRKGLKRIQDALRRVELA